MKRLAIVIGILLCCGSASAVERIIAATAKGAGANGTFFQTDVRLVNLSSSTATIDVTFLEPAVDNTAARTIAIFVAPRESKEIRDVVNSLFGSSQGIGAIRLASSADFLATSRTYTPSGDPGCPGTFGQFIPAVDPGTAITRGILPGIAFSDNPLVGFRTNVGFVNPSLSAVTIDLVLRAGTGESNGAATLTLPPLGFTQQAASVLFTPLGETASAFVELSASAPVLAYASVVDNQSGDSIFIPAGLDTGSPGSTVTITASRWKFEPATIEVAAGRPVTFLVRSVDVDHGISFTGVGPFTCSTFQGGQCVLKPQETVTVSFTPETSGSFAFFCTRFCGESEDGKSGHSTMRGTLVVK